MAMCGVHRFLPVRVGGTILWGEAVCFRMRLFLTSDTPMSVSGQTGKEGRGSRRKVLPGVFSRYIKNPREPFSVLTDFQSSRQERGVLSP